MPTSPATANKLADALAAHARANMEYARLAVTAAPQKKLEDALSLVYHLEDEVEHYKTFETFDYAPRPIGVDVALDGTSLYTSDNGELYRRTELDEMTARSLAEALNR